MKSTENKWDEIYDLSKWTQKIREIMLNGMKYCTWWPIELNLLNAQTVHLNHGIHALMITSHITFIFKMSNNQKVETKSANYNWIDQFDFENEKFVSKMQMILKNSKNYVWNNCMYPVDTIHRRACETVPDTVASNVLLRFSLWFLIF